MEHVNNTHIKLSSVKRAEHVNMDGYNRYNTVTCSKMADATECNEKCFPILVECASEKKGKNRLSCKELGMELQKVKTEIIDYKEIINMLLEELGVMQW
jgi:hypothetical protein